jgi:rubrerythrin
MTMNKEINRQPEARYPMNGSWTLRVRSEVVVCQDCGAMLPRSSQPETCALCGSGRLPE